MSCFYTDSALGFCLKLSSVCLLKIEDFHLGLGVKKLHQRSPLVPENSWMNHAGVASHEIHLVPRVLCFQRDSENAALGNTLPHCMHLQVSSFASHVMHVTPCFCRFFHRDAVNALFGSICAHVAHLASSVAAGACFK